MLDRTKWIEALRSGNFKQVGGALRSYDGFCCLGVACEVYKKELHGKWIKYETRNIFRTDDFETTTGCLGPKLLKLLGLTGKQETELIGMNDSGGKTFNEIADYLESLTKETT